MKVGLRLLKNRFPDRRFGRFREYLHPSSKERILDVGGSAQTWIGTGLEGAITLLNLGPAPTLPQGMSYLEGDACDLSFLEDKSFEIVFSNSVIEHVGDFYRQKQMAEELSRVGRSLWVQTPYRHFPIEVHFLFPLFQYLPKRLRLLIARIWPFSFAKMLNLDPVLEAECIWLLD